MAVLLAICAVDGCGEKVLENNELVQRNGFWYEKNAEIPFTGKVVEYYENGQMAWENELYEGKLSGKCSIWDVDGQKLIMAFYHNGLLNGRTVNYYRNGKMSHEWNYRFGKKHGRINNYYDNGEMKAEAWYEDGKLLTVKCWDENGDPTDFEKVFNIKWAKEMKKDYFQLEQAKIIYEIKDQATR